MNPHRPVHHPEDDPAAIFAHAYERGWTDGLPIIPPTAERVARMVGAVDRDPAEVIAELPPRNGAATIERVAINAVMAGCRPEYLPVLVAAVRAVAHPDFNLHGIQCTTNAASPALIVNGPIAKAIGLNAGRNCLGPGVRANATIGRALRLILLKVGGGIPYELDQATHGMPGKYTLCFAEDEENSPWEPLHVERGLRTDQSAVTAVGVNGTNNLNAIYETEESVLRIVADGLATMGHTNMSHGGGNVVVVFPPGHAERQVAQGYAKRDVQQFLWEHGRVPVA